MLKDLGEFKQPRLVMPGIVALEGPRFSTYEKAQEELHELSKVIEQRGLIPFCPMIILCDDSQFLSESVNNFLWATFTRSNPSHDIHGVNSYYEHKHWGCDNIMIDARTKPHHAPPLISDPAVEKQIERFFVKGASLGEVKVD
jgi:4-hydroxy-3-polyprenylbenzoate decarboxylase